MIAVLKRYGMALVFLCLIVLLMILGTMGVEKFGKSMVHDIGIEMKPRGENITEEFTK